jgi:hypothetical protein
MLIPYFRFTYSSGMETEVCVNEVLDFLEFQMFFCIQEN